MLFIEAVVKILLYSKVLISLSKEKLYPILKFSENSFVIEPNKFEFFLFIVLLFGIKFSSLSLKTVANFNSK